MEFTTSVTHATKGNGEKERERKREREGETEEEEAYCQEREREREGCRRVQNCTGQEAYSMASS